MITRFAPSPTGYLHRGHALAAREAFSAGGTCLLRIEDIDHTRCRPAYTDAIYEDLRWLGFDWPTPVRVQSAHRGRYAATISDLIERGLAYPCELSRSALKSGARTDGASLGHGARSRVSEQVRQAARFRTPDLPFAIRLNLGLALRQVAGLSYVESDQSQSARTPLDAWASSARPDPVLARRDIACSYLVAATQDDHLQGITHVVRGADLLEETPLQVLLQNLMGWTTPTYRHHALLRDTDGRKLSKTAKDQTIQSLREAGLSAADVLAGEG